MSLLRILALLAVFFGMIYLQCNRAHSDFKQNGRGNCCFLEEPVVNISAESLLTELSESFESLPEERETQED